MHQEQLLTADYIESQIGNVIEYYIRWEFEEDPFYGKARIKGLVEDDSGSLKIICDVIEGSDLEQAFEQEEVFMYSDHHPIYTGQLPDLYSANWVNTDGKKKDRFLSRHPTRTQRSLPFRKPTAR